jgi:TonB family protein
MSRVYSLLLHVLVLAFALLIPQSTYMRPKPVDPKLTMRLVAPVWRPRAITGGGGSFESRPATRGALPQVIRPIFIPPTVQRNEAPKLMVDSGLPDDTAIPRIDWPRIGDPLGALGAGPPSGGRGGPAGIGEGNGASHGDGANGPGSGFPRILGATPPQLVYKVEPEYTDEARKARYQGAVLLAVDIDARGAVVNVRVIRALGLGLDERAMEAVRRWRFKPAVKNGKAIDFPAAIEVSFHLL